MKTIVTKSQYDALMQIAEVGDKFLASELNIRPQTWNAIVMRGWVSVNNGYASVTDAAWDALA